MLSKRFCVIGVVFLWACKPPTPAEQMDSILSWVGTAGMVGEAWLRHTTPDTYSRQTLELSGKTLQKISKKLLESPPPSVDSAKLDDALTQTRATVAKMAQLIEAKDAPHFALQLDSLRAQQKIVKKLADSVESAQ
jgi:hypothetical protein